MYAIVSDCGRQYKIEAGQELILDFRDLPVGEKLVLDRVLAYGEGAGIKLGTPVLEGAAVHCQVLSQVQGPKLVVQKLRRRKTTRRKNGHRQLHTKVKVTEIVGV